MQGRDQTLVGSAENISAFMDKLKLWKRKISAGRLASFPNLNLFVEDNNNFSFDNIKNIFETHLEKLHSDLKKIFP